MVLDKILVVEDDPAILKLVVRFLEHKHYQIQAASDGQSALEVFASFSPDLVILDINLPDILGYTLCEKMQRLSDVYVLMLTSRSAPEDKKEGFRKGADDYLTKPFDLQELEWRIKAILRRKRHENSNSDFIKPLIFQDLIIDPNRREVKYMGQLMSFTSLEFDLIYFLASYPGRVWSRSELIEKVWKFSFAGDSRVVDVHIGQIRKKIQALYPFSPLIQTVRGVGYKFEDLKHQATAKELSSASN